MKEIKITFVGFTGFGWFAKLVSSNQDLKSSVQNLKTVIIHKIIEIVPKWCFLQITHTFSMLNILHRMLEAPKLLNLIGYLLTNV